MNTLVAELIQSLDIFNKIDIKDTAAFKIKTLIRNKLVNEMTSPNPSYEWALYLDVKDIEEICSSISIEGVDLDDESCNKLAESVYKLIKNFADAYSESDWEYPVAALKNEIKKFELSF